jgi:hypothetical protein
MKSLKEHLKENLAISDNNILLESKDKGTITDFILYHYDIDDIRNFTFELFSEDRNFGENTLKKKFEGDVKAMYDYIMEFVKTDAIIKIDSKRKSANDIVTTFKLGTIPFTVHSISTDGSIRKVWMKEVEFMKDYKSYAQDLLCYENYILFEKYAVSRLNDEGYLTPEIKRMHKFRFNKGFIAFDHIRAYDAFGTKQVNIPGLIANETLSYTQAYDIMLDYLKKQHYIK